MPHPGPSVDWQAVLDRVGLALAATDASERTGALLESLRDDFGWSLVEYWLSESGDYRLAAEVHTPSPELDDFAAVSAEMTIPVETLNPDWFRIIPGVTLVFGGIAYWQVGLDETVAILRRELVDRAGFQTRVFIPIPSGSFRQGAIILLDVERREATTDELQALGIATFLLGRSLPWDDDESPELLDKPVSRSYLDSETRCLVGPKASVRLTVAEWDLLSLLFSLGRKAVSFAELTERVWRAPEEYVGRAPLYELVARARRHLANVGGDYAITSVPRYGYMLERQQPARTEGGGRSENSDHHLSSLLIRLSAADGLIPALDEVLDAAIDLVHADGGYIRLFDMPTTFNLRGMPADLSGSPFVAQRGHSNEFIKYFSSLRGPVNPKARDGMRRGIRRSIEDMTTHPDFEPHRAQILACGFTSMHATTMLTRDGRTVGGIATTFIQRYTPPEEDLWMLDMYARLAAAVIERQLQLENLE